MRIAGSEIAGEFQRSFGAIIKSLKDSVVRQSLQFELARFEAELMAAESLIVEFHHPSEERAGKEVAKRTVTESALYRFFPRLLEKYRGIVLRLKLEDLPLPPAIDEDLVKIEQSIIGLGKGHPDAILDELGL